MSLRLSEREIKEKLRQYPLMFSRLIITGFPVEGMLKKSALIVGAGGLGVIVAEALARSGIGKLVIVDRDVVGPENFNRLGFSPDNVGKPKAEALAEKLKKLRGAEGFPEKFRLKVEFYYEDIVGWEKLDDIIRSVDIVFSAVDNDIARREINAAAVLAGKPLVSGATSADGFSGTIITVIPGKTPCYECYYRASTVRIATTPRVGQCDASVATTMAIVGAIQAQQGMNVLLRIGKIHPLVKIYVVPELEIIKFEDLKPDPECPVCSRLTGNA